jgi:hypothetical protein
LPQNIDYELTLFVDGGSRGNPGPAAIGALLIKSGDVLERRSECIGEATNNVAEYTALVEGLKMAAGFNAASIHVKADSELMVNQLLGKFKVKNPALLPLYKEAVKMLKDYKGVGIERIPREDNALADALVNEALDSLLGKKKAAPSRKDPRIIGFLTDFGSVDAWTGVVKGVMKRVDLCLDIIDISHDIPAYDIRKGAFVLETAVEHIPAKVFLAVVDPEVGGKRRGVIIGTTSGKYLIGPDNGLLMPAAGRLGGAAEAYVITGGELLPTSASATFHARDIFGPVAAYLATGREPREFGEEIDRLTLIAAPYGRAEVTIDGINAEVIDIDRYGTLRLNARRPDVEPAGYLAGAAVEVSFNGKDVTLTIVGTFSAVKHGEAMLLFDSSDYLCVSVNGGNAGLSLDLHEGDRVNLNISGPPKNG